MNSQKVKPHPIVFHRLNTKSRIFSYRNFLVQKNFLKKF